MAIGRDPQALALACGEVLTLADGILVSPVTQAEPPVT